MHSPLCHTLLIRNYHVISVFKLVIIIVSILLQVGIIFKTQDQVFQHLYVVNKDYQMVPAVVRTTKMMILITINVPVIELMDISH